MLVDERYLCACTLPFSCVGGEILQASVLLTPELRKEFDEWDQAFEREFADREKQSYRQWQDSIIDIDRVIP